MGTRCLIGILNEDGTVKSIQCSYDGYPGLHGVGFGLAYWYTKFSDILELIKGGSILSLKIDVKATHDYQKREVASRSYVPPEIEIAKNLGAYRELANTNQCKYAYVWMSGEWNVNDQEFPNLWERLTWKELVEKKTEQIRKPCNEVV